MLTETNETIEFQAWVASLPELQTRALASQAGNTEWHSLGLGKLRSFLLSSQKAYAIYRLNFYHEVSNDG